MKSIALAFCEGVARRAGEEVAERLLVRIRKWQGESQKKPPLRRRLPSLTKPGKGD